MSKFEYQISQGSIGQSAAADLYEGWWAVMLTAVSWGNVTLQVGDGTTWMDALDSSGNAITATANKTVVIAGGLMYRLNASAIGGGNPIIAKFYRVAD